MTRELKVLVGHREHLVLWEILGLRELRDPSDKLDQEDHLELP